MASRHLSRIDRISKDIDQGQTIPSVYRATLEERLVIACKPLTRQPRREVQRPRQEIRSYHARKKAQSVYLEIIDNAPHVFLPFILAIPPSACKHFDPFDFCPTCPFRIVIHCQQNPSPAALRYLSMAIPPPPTLPTTAWTHAYSSPTRNHQSGQLIGNGSFGFVWRIAEDRVMKEPKIYPSKNPDTAYSNMVNRAEILNEKAVYERLGSHDGIIQCFKALDESIELAFANQGDLSTYMQANPLPSRAFRAKWIQLLVDTFSYAHARRVVVQDVALRNILVHDNSLKLSDFGEAFLLPLDTDVERFCVNDTTPQIEILHLGCILYSIAVWQEFKYNYFDTERWPEAEELPATDDILFASIIKKCWNGEYASMEELQKDIHGMVDE